MPFLLVVFMLAGMLDQRAIGGIRSVSWISLPKKIGCFAVRRERHSFSFNGRQHLLNKNIGAPLLSQSTSGRSSIHLQDRFTLFLRRVSATKLSIPMLGINPHWEEEKQSHRMVSATNLCPVNPSKVM